MLRDGPGFISSLSENEFFGRQFAFSTEGQCAVKILQLDRQAALQELLVVLCQAVRLRDTRVDYLKISN